MKTRLHRAIARGLMCSTLALLSASPLASFAQTTVPYTWKNVRIVAGGYIDGIIAHPKQQGLFYARTDVGGAYRYDARKSKWIALNDWTPPADQAWTGIDSIAIDPRDPRMLFMVTGLYTPSWASNGAVLVSSDRGKSFTAHPLSFRVGGNEDGRNAGERLQVDPNDGSILFYGTSNSATQVTGMNGLWTSKDKGATWSQVSGFTALTSDGTGAGITFVAFAPAGEAKGKPTRTIYAGVSTRAAATNTTTLYVSNDAGVTWNPVTGGPANELPQRGEIGPDGNLYITYGNGTDGNGNYTYAAGPDGMTMGAVWKYDTVHHAWTNITPTDPFNYPSGYSGLSVDPSHPGTLVVMTMDHWWPMDTMYRSTDGGASWIDVGGATWNGVTPTSGTYAIRDASVQPWMVPPGTAQASFGNWGEVVIDPFDSAHAMYGTGGTLWTTSDLTDADAGKPTHWTVGASGIEETAVIALISPTAGVHLVSGLGDVCGFVHTSLTAPPPSQNIPLCSGGDGNGTGIDFAKNSPSTIVRVGAGGDNSLGTLSHDGGTTWTTFASKAGSTAGGGTVAISGDGNTIVWAPTDIAPVVSNDGGATWTQASGSGLPSLPVGAQVLSDGHSNNVFYAWNPTTGNFYSSSDKGVTWQVSTDTGLPSVPSYLAWESRISAVTGIPGEAKAGDVWITTPSGLFRSTDYGATWSQVDAASITSAISVGFGKAVTGSHYPTIYLSGTVNGVTGLFRSTNVGATWVQINDSLHQWGGVDLVVGDPRMFGTVYIGPGEARGVIYGTSQN